MSNFKGTPGQWRIGEKLGVFTNIVHDGSGIGMCPHVLAKVTTRYSSSEQAAANANVIAAAPELLEALQDALPWINSGLSRSAHEKAAAAIKKALGQ